MAIEKAIFLTENPGSKVPRPVLSSYQVRLSAARGRERFRRKAQGNARVAATETEKQN